MAAVAFQLRDYQQQLVDTVLEKWKSGKQRLLVQLPTGGGKTIVFGAIAHALLSDSKLTSSDSKILILAHREELLFQAADKVQKFTGHSTGIIKGSHPTTLDAPIQIASVQTLSRRPRMFEQVALIVIDEAHHTNANSYRTILNQYPEARHLGVTATPIRTDGAGFEDIFEEMVCGPTVNQLTDRGYLCPLQLFADPQPMKTMGAGSRGGDYNPSDLLALNRDRNLSGNLVSMWRRYAEGKRTVIFAINVAHSEAIAARFREAGISIEHLDGSIDPRERRAILDRFNSGETLVLTNCNLVSEGFDLPAIEAVQIARPTQSLALWLQQVGRALRTHPGKEVAVAIDHTRNWLLHGLPSQPRLWSLEGVTTDPDTIHHCPDCNTVFPERPNRLNDALLQCPECQAIIPSILPVSTSTPTKIERKPFELPEESGFELEEVSPAVLKLASELLHLQELMDKRETYQRSREWVVYRLGELNPELETWQACAKQLDYSEDWAQSQYDEQQALNDALEYSPKVA